ncbi:MAG: hypothetical protein IMX02_07440 [Limnochordaceae bacterium]|nr:hypothetical protein [Limnochordaceae bacterium]
MDTEARMDTDTQAFLSLFFSIEGILRRLAGGREEGFARLVARARDHNAVVRRFEQELRAFNELRNMLVHAPLTIPVARPSPEAVRALQRIYDHLTHPQLVLPRFARQVVSLTDDQPFADAIEAMHKTGYSQFPIYRGAAFQGLLTDGLMARWIAARLDHDFARLLRGASQGRPPPGARA